MREVDFQFPQAAFLITAVALILFMQIFLYHYRQKQIQKYAESALLPNLLKARSKSLSLAKIVLWGAIWILICIALMSPEGNVHYLPTSQKRTPPGIHTHEVIFLVDTSASMGVRDGENEQSRLEEAKAIMQNLISQLKETSIAVYAFTSVLTPIVPQTLDYLFTRLAVRELNVNEGDVGGTNFQITLKELKEKIVSDSSANLHTVLLFSDGGDNEVYKNQEISPSALRAVLNEISNSRDLQLKIFTVGLGQLNPSIIPQVTNQKGERVTSKLHPELLIKIAEQTGGRYYEGFQENNWQMSTHLLTAIKQTTLQKRDSGVNQREVIPAVQEEKISDLYYQIPLGLAIILLLGGLIVSEI